MIRNGKPYTNENGWEDKGLLSDKSKAEQEMVLSWIREHIKESRRVLRSRSSYGLKHDLQRDTRIYLTNNEFKDAMMLSGYMPVDPDELNWHYRIRVVTKPEKERVSFKQWLIRTYERDNSPKGDFARDVKWDEEFPRSNTKKAISTYLMLRGACQEARDTFYLLWSQYAQYRRAGYSYEENEKPFPAG